MYNTTSMVLHIIIELFDGCHGNIYYVGTTATPTNYCPTSSALDTDGGIAMLAVIVIIIVVITLAVLVLVVMGIYVYKKYSRLETDSHRRQVAYENQEMQTPTDHDPPIPVTVHPHTEDLPSRMQIGNISVKLTTDNLANVKELVHALECGLHPIFSELSAKDDHKIMTIRELERIVQKFEHVVCNGEPDDYDGSIFTNILPNLSQNN